MAKTHRVFENMADWYPLCITHADALLLLHEGMIQDPYDYVENKAREQNRLVYSGLVLEGMPEDSYLALVQMEMIERRLNQYEHVESCMTPP